MFVTLSGIVILVRLEQFWNAYSPICSTPSRIITLSICFALSPKKVNELIVFPETVILCSFVHSSKMFVSVIIL